MRTTCECGNEITRGICIECDAVRLASKAIIKRLEAENQRLKAVIKKMRNCTNCGTLNDFGTLNNCNACVELSNWQLKS